MVEVISEKKQAFDGNFCVITQELSDGSTRKISKRDDKITNTKTIQKDGSYILLNDSNVKIEELTGDGYLRKYNPETQKLEQETTPDDIVTEFYDNGNIKSISDMENGIYTSYYENGNLERREEPDYEICKDIDGNTNYEVKDGKMTINPDYFSYYRLGLKSKNNDIHWEEKVILDPKKKTLLCLGGNQTKTARIANGNINKFADSLGLTPEQKDNMQMLACYRPYSRQIEHAWLKVTEWSTQVEDDYRREILQKFTPFMARNVDGNLVKLPDKELIENFGNIIIQSHCLGVDDLVGFSIVFKEKMTELGYPKELQSKALKQVICITDNSQRDLTDDFGFTTIHRYSVKDGQIKPTYDQNYSAEYPVFVQDYQDFSDKKGNKAAFITTRPNEMIMVYDSILTDDDQMREHNEAFYTTDEKNLSQVGKLQARLMAKIGQAWYDNKSEMSDIVTFLQKITDKSTLHPFVTKALSFGKKLKAEKKNALINHHILKSAWNKFKNPSIEAPKTGVYKLLSKKYRE
ncbi:MAG: hypothetical protein IJS88_03530 [Alphaproteobacteria bacterium]|nr:hypothetical protein [Alphaproteobacteria bacterium]